MSDYCTLEELKKSLELTGTSFGDDDAQLAITAACRTIDAQTGRRFYPDPDANQTRKFLPLNPGYAVIDDLCEFTSLTDSSGNTWTRDTDFYLEPQNAAADGAPYTAIRTIVRPFFFTLADYPTGGWSGLDGRITVVGRWGWLSTPADIKEAAMILAGRFLRRVREAPFGIAGFGVDGSAVMLSRLDPDVAALIAPYQNSLIA